MLHTLTRNYARLERREAVELRGLLRWDQCKEPRGCPITVLNVSDGGVQVLSLDPLEVGVAASVEYSELHRSGIVKYCIPSNRGYLIGLKFRAFSVSGDRLYG